MGEIILASASPRRQELLKEILSDFRVVVSSADEVVPTGMKTDDIPEHLAMLKANDVLSKCTDAVVIGSDTIVVVDDKVLGKPKDEQDAFNMLKSMSGRKHVVMTGCAIVSSDKKLSFTVKTEVEFFELTDDDINSYIRTNDPFDKAGAYGIQSQGKTLVKAIYGDFYSVVGLPVGQLKRELKTFSNDVG